MSKGKKSRCAPKGKNQDAHPKENEGMFENFKNFVLRSVNQEAKLSKEIHIQDLLLPNWCQIHNASHSDYSCKMYQKAIKEVYKRISQTSKEIDDVESFITKSAQRSPNQGQCSQEEQGIVDQVWTLRFDGSRSKKGAGAGFELITPNGEAYLATHVLQFPRTNNVIKYESLVQGLLLAIKKGAKILHAFGDSEIVIKQVRKLYVCHDKRLSSYHNRVWDLIKSCDSFNIESVNRSKNQVANSLAQAASSLQPLAMDSVKIFTIELISTPSVLDNITSFQVFDDDKHILEFLTNSDVFVAQIID